VPKTNSDVMRPWPGDIGLFGQNSLRRTNIGSSHFTLIQGIFSVNWSFFNCRLTVIFLPKCLRNLVGWALRAVFLVPTLVYCIRPMLSSAAEQDGYCKRLKHMLMQNVPWNISYSFFLLPAHI